MKIIIIITHNKSVHNIQINVQEKDAKPLS